MLSLPIYVRGHAFVSAAEGIAAANVGLFDLPQFALRIELDHGFVLRFGKVKKRLVKVTDKGVKPAVDPSVFKKLRIKKIAVRGIFGADDAAVTAIASAGLSNVIKFLIDSAVASERSAEVSILPDYDKARLELEITVQIEFNLLVAIGIAFAMIFTKKKNTKMQENQT